VWLYLNGSNYRRKKKKKKKKKYNDKAKDEVRFWFFHLNFFSFPAKSHSSIPARPTKKLVFFASW
jgi:hypothetical protein